MGLTLIGQYLDNDQLWIEYISTESVNDAEAFWPLCVVALAIFENGQDGNPPRCVWSKAIEEERS